MSHRRFCVSSLAAEDEKPNWGSFRAVKTSAAPPADLLIDRRGGE